VKSRSSRSVHCASRSSLSPVDSGRLGGRGTGGDAADASGCVAASEPRHRSALGDGTSRGDRPSTPRHRSSPSSRGVQTERRGEPELVGASGCGRASSPREHARVCRPAEGSSRTRSVASTPYADASVARLGPHPMARGAVRVVLTFAVGVFLQVATWRATELSRKKTIVPKAERRATVPVIRTQTSHSVD
jgi:hypothetical protein